MKFFLITYRSFSTLCTPPLLCLSPCRNRKPSSIENLRLLVVFVYKIIVYRNTFSSIPSLIKSDSLKFFLSVPSSKNSTNQNLKGRVFTNRRATRYRHKMSTGSTSVGASGEVRWSTEGEESGKRKGDRGFSDSSRGRTSLRRPKIILMTELEVRRQVYWEDFTYV